MSDNEEENLFDEAAKIAAESSIGTPYEKTDLVVPEEKSQLDLAIDKVEEGDGEWKKIEKAMLGRHAKKFNRIMDEAPDKDFMRYYLKSLEFFKPKVVRAEPKREENEDNTVKIILTQKDSDGNIIELELNKDTGSFEQVEKDDNNNS